MDYAKVPECFPPDDRLALFVVSMTMAANDVQYAVNHAVRANPRDQEVGSSSAQERFGFWVRLGYGFLFEGVDALEAWEQEEPVQRILSQLPLGGAEALKKVRGARQQIGPKALEHVRHNTFHYPHPDQGKTPDSSVELAGVLRSLTDQVADIDLSDEAEHTFRFADQVVLGMAFRERHDPTDQRFVEQSERVVVAAVAFVELVKYIYLVYCQDRGHGFEIVD